MPDDPRLRQRRDTSRAPLLDLDAPDSSDTASGGLLDLDAPDSTTPRREPPRTPIVAPRPAPGRGRRMLGGIADAIGGFFGEAGSYGPGQEQSAGTTASRYEEPEETRRLAHPVDRTTPAQRRARVLAVPSARADATRVAPAGSRQQTAEQAAVAEGLAQKDTYERNFTPKNLRDLANRGDAHADSLYAAADAEPDPAKAAALRAQADDAKLRASNAEITADDVENSDTFGEIARSSLLGVLHDPNATAKRNMLEYASDPSLSFTPEEQTRDLGKNLPVGRSRGFDITKDVTAPLVGSLPLYVAGGMAGRMAAGAAAGALDAAGASRAAGIARALSAEIETTGIYGPKQAGVAGLREAGTNLKQNLTKLTLRGATQGQVVGAVQAAREAQQMGGDPIEAAAGSALMNVPFGIASEIGLSTLAHLGGVGERSIAGALDRVREKFGEVRDRYAPAPVLPTTAVPNEVVSAMDQGAAIEGKTAVSDKTLEGQRHDLARSLETLLDAKRESPTFGSESGLIERDPSYLTPMRGEPEEPRVPLRSQRDVAMERAGIAPEELAQSPREQADARVQMRRAAEEARAADEARAREAEQARIEQAAVARDAEAMGPLTLRETIERAGQDREAGDQLAADYHEAISKFADVTARMTDARAGDKPPGAKLTLDYARARSVLNEMRRKYGAQTGAAALATLAQNDDDLSDEEKQWLGISGVALATQAVRHLPPNIRSKIDAVIGQAEPEVRLSRAEWLHEFERQGVPLGEHREAINRALLAEESALGEGGTTFNRAELREVLDKMPTEAAPGEGGDRGKRFVSRLISHIEGLPKKWDQPVPAQQWLDYLGKKGQPYNSREFDAALRAQLEYAKQNKIKLTREQVIGIAEVNRPRVEEMRLTPSGRNTEELTVAPAGDPTAEEPTTRSGRVHDEGYGTGPHVAEVQEQYEAAQAEAQERHDRAERDRDRAYRQVEGEARALGISDRALHRAQDAAIVDGDYGMTIDADTFIQNLEENGEINTSPDLPADSPYSVRTVGERQFEVRNAEGETVATGRSYMEALANAERDGHIDLGGESNVLDRGERVAPVYDTLDEGYAPESWAVQTTDPELMGVEYVDREKLEAAIEEARKPEHTYEIVRHDADTDEQAAAYAVVNQRDELVYGDSGRYDHPDEVLQDYIGDHWTPNPDRVDDLRNALESWAMATDDYNEIESETYSLREGGIDEAGWDEQFREAQQADEDEAELAVTEGPRSRYVGGGNEDYWSLDADDREFVDRARERGAVGTLAPLTEAEYPDREFTSAPYGDNTRMHTLVFDPDLPHAPLPSPGRLREVNDPDQLQFDSFGPGSGAGVMTVRYTPQELALPPRVLPKLAAEGDTKWSTTQRVPGGERYRELVLVADNNQNPERYTGKNAGSHRHYRIDDLLGHLRGADRRYFPGDVETPAIAELRVQREGMLARLNAIVSKHEAMPSDVRADPTHPDVQRLQSDYMRVNDAMNQVARREEALRNTLPSRKGVVPEVLFAVEEKQSDYYQDAVRPILPSGEEAGEYELQKIAGYIRRGEPVPDELQLQPEGFRQRRALTPEEEAQRAGREEMVREAQADKARAFEAHAEAKSQLDTARDAMYGKLKDAGFPGITANPERVEPWLKTLPPNDPLHDEWDSYKNVRNALRERVQLESVTMAEADRRVSVHEKGINDLGVENPLRPPTNAFADAETIDNLLVGRHILEVVESDADGMAWSHSSNRMAFSQGYSKAAATLNYDKRYASTVRRIFERLGEKDVKPDLITMSGYSFWRVRFTPEMKAAIKKGGVSLLSVASIMAGSPDDAEAQDGRQKNVSPVNLYATHAGMLAAGGLIGAMMVNRKLRAMVKENRELSRALHLDDLSGLSNKRALSRAIESVDRDDALGWVVLDGNHFKAMNDAHGHPEGDKAIAHFGKVVRDAAEKVGVPMRGFRAGGDEFAFAAPKSKIAELTQAIEEASPYTKGEVTTSLTGAWGNTFAEADAMLNATKEANRRADPSLRRPGEAHAAASPEVQAALARFEERLNAERFAIESGAHHVEPTRSGVARRSLKTPPTEFYSNPIGPALRELRRAPGAAGLAAVGALASQQEDNEYVRRTGLPLIALAAMHAVGSRRIAGGIDKLAQGIVEQLRKTRTGADAVRFLNPDRLVPPEVLDAVKQYERDRSAATGRASRAAEKARALGPVGDRAVSDVLDNEAWEGMAAQTPEVLATAIELSDELEQATKAQLAAGTLDPSQVIQHYGGPRKYAFYEVANALVDKPGRGGGPGPSPRIAKTQTRTLDIPIRDAQRKLDKAHASGDVAAIKAAQQELDYAEYESAAKRVERGEIRESSYRTAAGIEKAYQNVAAAKLFETLRATPGVAHPEWIKAVDDYQTATTLARAAQKSGVQADIDAAQLMVGDATATLDDLKRRFKQKGQDYTALPDTPAWGMLRGAIVQRDVAHSLEGFGESGTYGKALRAWKEMKTVFNPGTNVGNILSNVTALHMGDVPAWLQPLYYKRALADLKANGEAAQALTDAGVMHINATNADGSSATTSSSMRSAAGLEELLGTTRPETADVIRRESEKNSEYAITESAIAQRAKNRLKKGAAVGALVGAARGYDEDNPERTGVGAVAGMALGALAASGKGDVIRRIYGHEDNLARMAIYLRRRALGDTKEQAVERAVAGLGNFRSRSPALRMVANTVSPFVLYQAKAVPAFAKSIIDHPYKWLSLMALWGGVNELSKREVGEVPEEDRDERDRATWGYFFPGFTQLPITNPEGDKGATDMARYTPLGGLATGAPPGSVPDAFSGSAPQIATPGGPVIDLALRAANVHPFTKQPLFQRDAPTSTNIGTALREATDFALPSALGFHLRQLTADYDNQDWAKLKNDLLGPVGSKPRFIRPGAAEDRADFEYDQRMRELNYLRDRAHDANRNPERDSVIDRRFDELEDAAEAERDRRTTPPARGARP